MSNYVRRILAKLFSQQEQARYIDFVEASHSTQSASVSQDRSADNNGKSEVLLGEQEIGFISNSSQIRDGSTQEQLPTDALSGNTRSHPDDDWFQLPSEYSIDVTLDSDRGASDIGVHAEGADDEAATEWLSETRTVGGLDPELATLMESLEATEPDHEVRTAEAELDDIAPVHDDEWLFEGLTPDSTEPLHDEDNTALLAWSDEDLELGPPPTIGSADDGIEESVAWRAGARAAALVGELGLSYAGQRRRTLRWLEELLREFPHGSSHAAIARLVLSGLPIDTIDDAISIVRMWRRDSTLWLYRRFDKLERCWVIGIDHRNGQNALTWKKAAALVASVDAAEAKRLLCSDWRDYWLQLESSQDGSATYATFAGMQIDQLGGFDIWFSDPSEQSTESYDWLRGIDPEIAGFIAPDGRLAYHAIPQSTRNPHETPIQKDKDAPADA